MAFVSSLKYLVCRPWHACISPVGKGQKMSSFSLHSLPATTAYSHIVVILIFKSCKGGEGYVKKEIKKFFTQTFSKYLLIEYLFLIFFKPLISFNSDIFRNYFQILRLLQNWLICDTYNMNCTYFQEYTVLGGPRNKRKRFTLDFRSFQSILSISLIPLIVLDSSFNYLNS